MDINKENIAVAEANKIEYYQWWLLVDTNCDPEVIRFTLFLVMMMLLRSIEFFIEQVGQQSL